MATAARLTNIQQEAWNFIRQEGPVDKINWSEMLTKLDPKRKKGYTVTRIHEAVVKMSTMTPQRMKLTHDTKNFGTGLEAI